jgi:Fe-S cluster biogenesis protein NfuA
MESSDVSMLETIESSDQEVSYELVAATVETLRPGVQQDGGDLELVKIEGLRVFIKLSGACTTCTLAGQTLGGVRRKLVEVLGIPVRVVPAV